MVAKTPSRGWHSWVAIYLDRAEDTMIASLPEHFHNYKDARPSSQGTCLVISRVLGHLDSMTTGLNGFL